MAGSSPQLNMTIYAELPIKEVEEKEKKLTDVYNFEWSGRLVAGKKGIRSYDFSLNCKENLVDVWSENRVLSTPTTINLDGFTWQREGSYTGLAYYELVDLAICTLIPLLGTRSNIEYDVTSFSLYYSSEGRIIDEECFQEIVAYQWLSKRFGRAIPLIGKIEITKTDLAYVMALRIKR